MRQNVNSEVLVRVRSKVSIEVRLSLKLGFRIGCPKLLEFNAICVCVPVV